MHTLRMAAPVTDLACLRHPSKEQLWINGRLAWLPVNNRALV
ncbi:hypothetical protein ABZ567_28395 [Streptomyces sp. NPDC016459]